VNETIHIMSCGGEELLAIYHPAVPPSRARLGLVMVVGGAQYRVGSHRLYWQLARYLASAGIPVLRFDCRGLGDSSGEWLGFEQIQADINVAINQIMAAHGQLDGVLLWGLCDGASAALLSLAEQPLVKGAILVNPWLESHSSQARVMLRHYYRRRLFSADLWRKIGSGAFSPVASWRSFIAIWRQRKPSDPVSDDDLQSRLRRALLQHAAQVEIIVAANDLTARTFMDWFSAQNQRDTTLSSIPLHIIANADHTFSYPDQRRQLLQLSADVATRRQP